MRPTRTCGTGLTWSCSRFIDINPERSALAVLAVFDRQFAVLRP
jgi:hypothetical protein